MATTGMARRVVASTKEIQGRVRCKRRGWPSRTRARPSIRPCKSRGGIGRTRRDRATPDALTREPFVMSVDELVQSINNLFIL
jgi:hypothetical protein